MIKMEQLYQSISLYNPQGGMAGGEQLNWEVVFSNSRFFYRDAPGLEQVAYRGRSRKVMAHLPFYGVQLGAQDDMVRDLSLKLLFRALDWCQTLGITRGVFHPGLAPVVPPSQYNRWYATGQETIAQLHNKARQTGVELLAENTWEKDFWLFDRLTTDFPDLQICFDIAHSHCFTHSGPLPWLERYADRIKHVHLSDNHLEEDEHLCPGEGLIDFSQLPFGEDITYTLESPPEKARKAVEYLKNLGLLG